MQEQEMTNTPTTRSRHSFSARFAMITTVSLGLLAGPVAFASTAAAAPSHSNKDNCSVTALKPTADHGRNNKKDSKSVDVKFAFKIHCDKRTKVYFEQKMFQNHGRWDKRIGSDKGWVWVGKNSDERIYNVKKVYADRGDKFVKVFHEVKIQFKNNDKKRDWASDYDKSPTAYIRVDNGRK